MNPTYFGAASTPSSAAGFSPFSEWLAQQPAPEPSKVSSLSLHRFGCRRFINDLDVYPEGDVFCRNCGRVLGTDFTAIHNEHQRRAS